MGGTKNPGLMCGELPQEFVLCPRERIRIIITLRHDANAYAPIDVKMQPVPFPSVLKMVFVCPWGGNVT